MRRKSSAPHARDDEAPDEDDARDGQRIAQLRDKFGLNQDDLAERMNTTGVQISRLETGQRKMTMAWMRRFARAFGVPLSDLLPDAEVRDRLGEDERQLLELLRQHPESNPRELISIMLGLNRFVEAQATRKMMRERMTGNVAQVTEIADLIADMNDKERAGTIEIVKTARRMANAAS